MALVIDPGRMSSRSGRGIHPFFFPKGIEDTVDAGEDLSQNRRKRRRTKSPESGLHENERAPASSWYHQLQAAAHESPPSHGNSNILESHRAPEGNLSDSGATKRDEAGFTDEHETTTARKLGVTSMQARRPRAPRSPSLDAERSSTPSNMPHSKAQASPTRMKRMLKLRSDGKLRSSKPPKGSGEAIAKRKRKSPESKVSHTFNIVIIKYGKNSTHKRSISRIIQDISEGKIRWARKAATADLSPEPIVSPKATHPFFLEIAARSKEPKVPARDEEHDHPQDTRSEILKASSPSKASLLSTANNRTAWANIVGSFQQAPRLPGTLEAIWPPADITHVHPVDSPVPSSPKDDSPGTHGGARKLKNAVVCILKDENLLDRFQNAVMKSCLMDRRSEAYSAIRKPDRVVLSGQELQRVILQRLKVNMPNSISPSDPFRDELASPQRPSEPQPATVHSGLRRLYEMIPYSMSAFDKFECESEDWARKYAPKHPEDVLQETVEVMLLRDWLQSLTISAVDSVSSKCPQNQEACFSHKGENTTKRRRRKKRAEALDGFVVSSDEEADQMDAISNLEASRFGKLNGASLKGSVARVGRFEQNAAKSNNAVVISGPPGCGKTAAVYAIAQGLDFEVFEINSGSRRSGKDLLDRVGDMTRNHLVNRAQDMRDNKTTEDIEDLLRLSNSLKEDIETGRQGTMQSFFKPQTEVQQKPKGGPKRAKVSPSERSPTKKSKPQKQSVILLEEVDVIFEEDKQFWAVTLEMITRSKRPVIMTCSDERALPLEDLPLFAILRFSPPPESLATDYLMLLACNEGHLLSRDAVAALYKAKHYDLRASVAELQLFCQMAIGDTAGGLGWFLIRTSTNECQNEKGEVLRVVSRDSFSKGVDWSDNTHSKQASYGGLEHDTMLLSSVWQDWGLDLAEFDDFVDPSAALSMGDNSRENSLTILRSLEDAYESLSAADVCSPWDMREGCSIRLDTTQPRFSEKWRTNYVEGAALLEAEPLIDQTGTSLSIALALRALARRSIPKYQPIDFETITQKLPHMLQIHSMQGPVTPQSLEIAFAAIKAPTISVLGSPTSAIVTDVAPYIRSITAFDLRLEDQRRQLETASSAAKDGGYGKLVRKTRASRAALEGGAKATTRRERWFPAPLDFGLVERTGSSGWIEAALRRTEDQEVERYHDD